MSILIKGLKMPKGEALKVAICDGIASVYLDEGKADYYSVIELPDHGDLIDRDKLFKKAEEWEVEASAEFERYKLGETNWEQTEKEKWRIALLERIGFKYDIADAPVIIPAERSEDE